MTRDEHGQGTVIIVGLAVVLLLAVAVVVDASAAYLQRQGLATLADGAALAAVDAGATGAELYTDGLDDGSLQLSAGLARAGVADYLRRAGADEKFPGLRFRVEVDEAEGRVVVRLRAPLELPLTVPGSPDRPMIGAAAAAVVATAP